MCLIPLCNWLMNRPPPLSMELETSSSLPLSGVVRVKSIPQIKSWLQVKYLFPPWTSREPLFYQTSSWHALEWCRWKSDCTRKIFINRFRLTKGREKNQLNSRKEWQHAHNGAMLFQAGSFARAETRASTLRLQSVAGIGRVVRKETSQRRSWSFRGEGATRSVWHW